ncbi:MAG TPA: response regulator [Candidatus Limnocylindrales bacterium]|nr:response regulator [Candidatus Limnocylindrales bacterium]
MSETIAMPPLGTTETKHTPTVYFIDDSATMREVIKIAFRRENINVITCADAASALAGFEQHPPDVVITDVIMPDQDGYSVCSQIKQNPQFGKTPVILMSGVVNKSVADRAVAVQADELVRKPFQPQELIGRVRNLLNASHTAAHGAAEHAASTTSLDSLFAPAQAPGRVGPLSPAPPVPGPIPAPPLGEAKPTDSPWPRALADAFMTQNAPFTQHPAPAVPAAPTGPRAAATPQEIQKLRVEISRLELLVKKLQTELQIERQYNQALELHVKTLTQVE